MKNVDLIRLKSNRIPSVFIPSTDGSFVDLSKCNGVSVVYAYPRTSPVNQSPIEGWDSIPGAKGCTIQSQEFAKQHKRIIDAGANRVFGLSTQNTDYQNEVRGRLHLPYHMLSDQQLELTAALGLPTFEVGGMTLLSRLTMIVNNGWIQQIFFPVNDPEANASEVLTYLTCLKKP